MRGKCISFDKICANSDALTSLIKDELHQCSLKTKNTKGLATDGALMKIGKNHRVPDIFAGFRYSSV